MHPYLSLEIPFSAELKLRADLWRRVKTFHLEEIQARRRAKSCSTLYIYIYNTTSIFCFSTLRQLSKRVPHGRTEDSNNPAFDEQSEELFNAELEREAKLGEWCTIFDEKAEE